MIDAKLLAATKTRLAGLDFSAENAKIAEIEGDNIRMDRRIEEAEKRCAEIEAMTARKLGREPAEIADALLQGGVSEAVEAGVDDEALKEERLTLRKAMSELRGRQTANHNAIVEVQQGVNGQISDVLAPLAQALIDTAKSAGDQFVGCWAGLSSLRGMGLNAEFAHALFAADKVTGSLHTSRGFLGTARTIDTPSEVLDVLKPLADLGKAVGARAHPSRVHHIDWQ